MVERVRLASVRLNDGGLAVSVSPDGLLCYQPARRRRTTAKLSTKENDLTKTGFTPEQEPKELKA